MKVHIYCHKSIRAHLENAISAEWKAECTIKMINPYRQKKWCNLSFSPSWIPLLFLVSVGLLRKQKEKKCRNDIDISRWFSLFHCRPLSRRCLSGRTDPIGRSNAPQMFEPSTTIKEISEQSSAECHGVDTIKTSRLTMLKRALVLAFVLAGNTSPPLADNNNLISAESKHQRDTFPNLLKGRCFVFSSVLLNKPRW